MGFQAPPAAATVYASHTPAAYSAYGTGPPAASSAAHGSYGYPPAPGAQAGYSRSSSANSTSTNGGGGVAAPAYGSSYGGYGSAQGTPYSYGIGPYGIGPSGAAPAQGYGASHGYGSGAGAAGAIALYQPNSLYGLYYNEDLHGPFATGLGRNPFTPGLDPLSTSSCPQYSTGDPLKDKYPARRTADDPLNWINEALFHVSAEQKELDGKRVPLRGLSSISYDGTAATAWAHR